MKLFHCTCSPEGKGARSWQVIRFTPALVYDKVSPRGANTGDTHIFTFGTTGTMKFISNQPLERYYKPATLFQFSVTDSIAVTFN